MIGEKLGRPIKLDERLEQGHHLAQVFYIYIYIYISITERNKRVEYIGERKKELINMDIHICIQMMRIKKKELYVHSISSRV